MSTEERAALEAELTAHYRASVCGGEPCEVRLDLAPGSVIASITLVGEGDAVHSAMEAAVTSDGGLPAANLTTAVITITTI